MESEIDMELESKAIVLRAAEQARTGWDDAFRQLGVDSSPIDDSTGSEWDDTEWEWE